jgi:uncharacterized protein (DUF1697 family)
VNFQSHLDRLVAACTVSPGHRAASVALAGLDAALRQNAARFPESFRALVRDSPWASVETAQRDALRVLRPPGAQKKVAFPREPRAVEQRALLVAAHQTQPLAVQSALAAESV